MSDERAGEIITFFSYKGGTGRTMALANVAWILASHGKRVLTVDWDLDSPGLHRFFHPFLDDDLFASTPGVMEMLSDFGRAAADPHLDRTDPAWHERFARVLPHAVSLDWSFPGPGRWTSSRPGGRDARMPRQSPGSTGTPSTPDWVVARSSPRCARTCDATTTTRSSTAGPG